MREHGATRLSHPAVKITDKYYLVYKYLINDIKEAVRKYGKGSVVDLGCGNKPYEIYFNTNNIDSYIGVDVVQSSENRVDVISDVTNLPFDSNKFDTVFSTQVMEHVPNTAQYLMESFRILKRGGILIITCPMYWPLHEEPYDFYRFTKFGLQYLCEQHGFEVIKIKSNGGSFALLGLAFFHAVSVNIKILNLIANTFFYLLDKIFGKETNTSNYILIAQKK